MRYDTSRKLNEYQNIDILILCEKLGEEIEEIMSECESMEFGNAMRVKLLALRESLWVYKKGWQAIRAGDLDVDDFDGRLRSDNDRVSELV